MATAGTERYSRINLILVDGGTKITRRIFIKRVLELSPPGKQQSVDEFLQSCKPSLLKTKTGKNRERTLYPVSGTTNLDEWDLYLLCFILQEVCNLDKINKMDIGKLQRMRNDICHLSNPTLEELSYRTQLEEIKIIFQRSLKMIGDQDFEKELNQLVDKCEKGPLAVDDIVRIHHHYSKLELERNERLDDFMENQKESTTRIEQGIHSLMAKLAGYSNSNQEPTVVKVPGATLILEMNNCPEEKETSVLRLLVKLFQEKILDTKLSLSDDLSELTTHELRESVSKLFDQFTQKGRPVVKVQQKCLLLEIKCDTIVSFVELVNDYTNGCLINEFQDILQAVKCLEGCENVDFNIYIPHENILNVIDEIVTILENSGSKEQSNQQEENVDASSPKSQLKATCDLAEVLNPAQSEEALSCERQIREEMKTIRGTRILKITAPQSDVQQPTHNEVMSPTLETLKTKTEQTELRERNFEFSTIARNDPSLKKEVVAVENSGYTPLVAAIDFGTTYSGYAYSFRSHYKLASHKIPTSVWFSRFQDPFCKIYEKGRTSTTILLKPDRSFHSFGFEAEDKYCKLAEEDEHREWYYFRRFKMLLHNQLKLNRNTTIADAEGKCMPARIIFTLAIRYMKDHLLSRLNEYTIYPTIKEIMWVLTVPAIWDEPAKQFMREAAIDAGIPSEVLQLALEAEAASIYHKSRLGQLALDAEAAGIHCKSLSRKNWSFEPHTRYMVIELGGGIVEMVVHEVKPDGTLKELYKASGGAWGGTLVNDSFFELLRTIFGSESIEHFKNTYKADFLDFETTFEIKKRKAYHYMDEGRLFIPFPQGFYNSVKSIMGLSAQEMIVKAGFEGKIKICRGNKICFKIEVIGAMFEPYIKSIISHAKSVYNNPKVQRLDKILMAGGFSECILVTKAVKEAFPYIQVVEEVNPMDEQCVLWGAVLFGIYPWHISSRVVRYTYGVAVEQPFVNGYHPEAYRLHRGGIYCVDFFSKFTEVDRDVGILETIKKTFDVTDTSKPLRIEIYVSKKENPTFVTEPGSERLGEIVIHMPMGGWRRNASVEVEIRFGGTEVKVRATDVKTQKQQNATFDFLGLSPF